MATITRGAVTLTPHDVLGWRLTRPGRAIVHDILGDPEPDVTDRAPGLRRGEVRTLWATYAAAEAAETELRTTGAAWEWDIPEHGLTMLAKVVGDVTVESADDVAGAWLVVIGVQEVMA